uniref:cytochrome P450 81Q32-like isoform X2 n=1 Tax=Erigeron canadensis TaxID=72917 RepID=UPI001CB98707|nr:cytochrome P450 81Q32-like isoform X2 [Erigeron canadensis]
MDETHQFFIFLSSLVSLILIFKMWIHKKEIKNLAPSPPSIPIIGHLHLINGSIHRVLHQLSSKYGPVMALRFGSRPVLVVTSSSAVEECFTKNDIILANRPLLLSGKYLEYDHTTVGSAPYGHLWRDLRRIMTLELLSTTRMKSFTGVREDEGYKKRMMKLQHQTNKFTQNLIEEIRSKWAGSSSEKRRDKTYIDALLSLQEQNPEYYTDDIIKGNILTLLLAGTDTSSVTIEWAMSLLLNHPNVLERAKTELDTYLGHERLVQETDIPNIPYIQYIINETLRLFPAAPILVPHEPSQDCTIGGFDVARGTMVLVNAWAIHRDPMVWDEPLSFKPERFEKVEKEGYNFIPFGMGRRQCPGSGLATQVVWLALASLIQCFDWKRTGEELVSLSEGKGLIMPKNEPLEAMCRPSQRISHILKEL